ncbi:MAG: hypothetical protein D6732_14870 [Methanobacteriota archaeon]|nr:MAG: hypothetical protein D6732_14870 [Euryarchaeota archaeon]
MKIIALADTHFGHRMGRPINGEYPSVKAKFTAFRQIIEFSKQIDADIIVHCGDVFDIPNPPQPIKRMAVTLFEEILETGRHLIILPGNHDRSVYENNLLQFYYPNFHIINSLKEINVGSLSFIGFPYTKQPEQLMAKAIRSAEKSPNQAIIICHQTFKGATVGPQRFTFRDGLPPPKLPSNVPFIISGHIHRSQQVHNVLYPGSTERTGFPEVIEPKGFLLIDTEAQSVTFKELQTMPMKVEETSFEEALLHEPDENTYTLLRIINKPLSEKEIAQIHAHTRKYPLLEYSPKSPELPLQPLYHNPPPFHPISWTK